MSASTRDQRATMRDDGMRIDGRVVHECVYALEVTATVEGSQIRLAIGEPQDAKPAGARFIGKAVRITPDQADFLAGVLRGAAARAREASGG